VRAVIPRRLRGALALLALLAGPACSTRVVDLALPDAAAAGTSPDAAMTKPPPPRADGASAATDAAVSCEMVRRAVGEARCVGYLTADTLYHGCGDMR
jgi:hypothetical protein